MKTINRGKELMEKITVTNSYENDLKKAEAKGYTFGKTLHQMLTLFRF